MQQAGQQIQEVALRIREMRNIMGYSTAEMAIRTQVTEATYVEYESGLSTFLSRLSTSARWRLALN